MKLASIFAALVVTLLTACPASAGNNQEDARPFAVASLQQLLDAQKGRPVIVHFWGLTCGNCMAELKEWGDFARAHPDAMLVLVNWDQRGARADQVTPALQKAGLGSIPSFALGSGFEEKLRFAIDRDWMGELPYTRLISIDGSATTFSGSADFADLGAWLAKEKR
jgi:thiol-disulfide isomerase/thioredoxin